MYFLLDDPMISEEAPITEQVTVNDIVEAASAEWDPEDLVNSFIE